MPPMNPDRLIEMKEIILPPTGLETIYSSDPARYPNGDYFPLGFDKFGHPIINLIGAAETTSSESVPTEKTEISIEPTDQIEDILLENLQAEKAIVELAPDMAAHMEFMHGLVMRQYKALTADFQKFLINVRPGLTLQQVMTQQENWALVVGDESFKKMIKERNYFIDIDREMLALLPICSQEVKQLYLFVLLSSKRGTTPDVVERWKKIFSLTPEEVAELFLLSLGFPAKAVDKILKTSSKNSHETFKKLLAMKTKNEKNPTVIRGYVSLSYTFSQLAFYPYQQFKDDVIGASEDDQDQLRNKVAKQVLCLIYKMAGRNVAAFDKSVFADPIRILKVQRLFAFTYLIQRLRQATIIPINHENKHGLPNEQALVWLSSQFANNELPRGV